MSWKWSKEIDFLLIFSVVGLIIIGLLAIYSSSQAYLQGETSQTTNYFVQQLVWIAIGILFLIGTVLIPPKLILDFTPLIYGISILTLLVVLFFGYTGSGATRWIRLGPLRFQPSEFAKIATLLMLARYLSNRTVDINRLKDFTFAAIIPLVPFVLIVRQPDLGTSLVFVAMVLPLMYWAGLKESNLLIIVAPVVVLFASFNFYAFLLVMSLLLIYLFYSRRHWIIKFLIFGANIAVGLVTPILWNQLKPYQQQRIKIFLNPEADPLGAGYQIIQSKVAIGSGGLWGKGFLRGSQTQLRFLPEQHTDFIFAVIGEEFGFIGVFLVLILFGIFLYRCLKIARSGKSGFLNITTLGIGTIIGFQAVVNMGMTIGLLPVTGLPLPFISYGGSAMLLDLVMVGLILSAYRNRFEYI